MGVFGRGAAINRACMARPYYLDSYPLIVERSWHKLAAVGVFSSDAATQPALALDVWPASTR
jgi:hypothetical protein